MLSDAVVSLLVELIESPPTSREAADALEGRFLEERSEEVEQVVFALSVFEPTDEPPEAGLMGFAALRSAASNALHDLGRHYYCLHDVTLVDRP